MAQRSRTTGNQKISAFKFGSQRQLQTDITGYLFIAPNLIGLMLFTIFPLLFSLVISFSSWDYTQGFSAIKFNGGENYITMWSDEWFTTSFINSFYFALGVVPLTIVLALVSAVLIERYVIGKTPVRLAMFMPYVSNIVAISIVWVMMYSPYGPITYLIKAFGVENPPKWLGDYNWAMPAIIVMSIWAGIGYAVMIYSSSIQSLPEDLYDAARIDGANEAQKFLKITVPLLSPTTFFLMVTMLIGNFQAFGQVHIMTHGGPGTATNVLIYYIYTAAFSFFKMGYAASISWVLFVILFIITLFLWRAQRKWVNYI